MVNIINFLLPMIFMAIFWSRIYAIVLHHIEQTRKTEKSLFQNTNDSSNASNLNCKDQGSLLISLTSSGKKKKETKRMRRSFRGSRYIGFIVMLFYFCWLPYVTTSLLGNMCKGKVFIPRVLYDIFLTLGFLNSALNPFLYPFHDKHFKEAFKDMWKRAKTKLLLKNVCLRKTIRRRSCT